MPSDLDIHFAASGVEGRIVDACVLHTSKQEQTEKIWIEIKGQKSGPYVRKTFSHDRALAPYENILRAQKEHAFSAIPRVISISCNPQPGVILAWANGESLEKLAEGKPYSAEDATNLMQLVAEGVNELHKSPTGPIIHRDLTPANILYDAKAKRVSIVDLSISRIWNAATTHDTQLFGTPLYASPEQYGYAQTSERSDVFSLGLVYFYLLCGRDASHTDFADGFASVTDKLPRAIITKATCFDPNQRFQSVDELLQALRRPAWAHQLCKPQATLALKALYNIAFFFLLAFLCIVSFYVSQHPSQVIQQYSPLQLFIFYGLAIPCVAIGLFIGLSAPSALPERLKRHIPQTFGMRLVRMMLFLGIAFVCFCIGALL